MKKIFYYFLFLLILVSGCKDENPVIPPDETSTGSLVLKLDQANAPKSITTVVAYLSRAGYETITAEMNIHSDSTADISLNGIASGKWLLRVDAKNETGTVEYSGETEVTIIPSQIIQVYLTLYPIQGSTGGIHLTVSWGLRWKDFVNNPVLWPSGNPSNPAGLSQGKVIFENGIYKMWYTSVYNSAVASIWYAESPDGINWTTIGSQPVLSPGPAGSWDSYTITTACVIKDGDIYKMYYAGFNGHPYQTTWKTGLATSTDGIHWTKLPNPVLTENSTYYRLQITSIVKYNNLFYGYFSYSNSSHTKYFIGLATSSDGVTWNFSNSNPILSENLSWEIDGVTFPAVVYDSGKFKMYYSNRHSTAFGYAESVDGINFVKDYRPIFTKEETVNNWPYIAYPFYIKNGNVNRIYYTAGYEANYFGMSFIQR